MARLYWTLSIALLSWQALAQTVAPKPPVSATIQIERGRETVHSASNAIGVRRIAVLLLTFNDDAAPAYDTAAFRALFEEVNRFYGEVSYGQFSFAPDFFGPLAVAMNKPCSDNEQVFDVPIAAKAAAAAAGVDLAPYQTLVFAGSGCGPARGGGAHVYVLRPGVDAGTLAHELGHTLGLRHADYLYCPGSPYVPHPQLRSYVPNDSGCTRFEYGDRFDVMGGGGFHHFNAVYKEALGWVKPLEIRDSGTYRIVPIEATNGPKALKIVPDEDDPVYVEYRQPIGFDRYDAAFLDYSGVFQGALVHIGGMPSTLISMDAVTASDGSNNPILYQFPLRPALLPGATYVDPRNRFKLKTLSATLDGLDVQITVLPAVGEPRFSFGQPLDGTAVFGKVTVTVVAAEAGTISKVELYCDGRLLESRPTTSSQSYKFEWDATDEVPGSHQLSAIAFGVNGDSSIQTAIVVVHRPPTVIVVARNASLALGQPTQLLAQVQTDEDATVGKVEFLIDGPFGSRRVEGSPLNNRVYTYDWASSERGLFSVTAQITDSAGFRNWSRSLILAVADSAIATQGVVSAANFRPVVSPGSLVSIFGGGFSTDSESALTIPLPLSLAGVSVSFNGIPAPVLFSSPDQINVQLPWGLEPACTQQSLVEVAVSGVNGVARSTLNCAPAAPAIFRIGVRQAVAINLDGTIAGRTGSVEGVLMHPAKAGGTLILFGTGFGPVSPAALDGEASMDVLRSTIASPAVTIGGVSATVTFSGLSPGFVGVNQINVVVPEGITPGDFIPILVKVNSREDASATVAVAQ